MKQAMILGATVLVLAALLGGCAPAAPTEESQDSAVEATEEAEVTTEEPTATLTDTPHPTNTPRPTATRTPRPTSTPRPTATGQSATATTAADEVSTLAATEESAEFVPPGTTIWVLDTTASEMGSSEACPAPIFADFYGLVRIETIDNGITWMRAQDNITYTLLRQSPNVYWGTGQSIFPGYTLTITTVFTSPTGLGATFVLIDQAVESCNHYWKYGGTLR